MGIRPTVRGSVMNPIRPPARRRRRQERLLAVPALSPRGASLPWAYKTRKKKNPTNKFIVKRRNGK